MKRMITLLAILIASANTYAADVAISISGSSFGSPITVEVGDIITWTNNDPFNHDVTFISVPSGASSTGSGPLAQSGTFPYTVTEAGSYSYFCSIHGAGMSGSFTATAPATTGISNRVNELPVKLFPNPATDQVTIDMQNISADRIKVTDSKGTFIREVRLSAVSQNIDLSDLTEGIYSLSFYHNEKLLGFKKLVKK